ncbi:hypothetical protein ACJX0J_011224, partial [Zea mays]
SFRDALTDTIEKRLIVEKKLCDFFLLSLLIKLTDMLGYLEQSIGAWLKDNMHKCVQDASINRTLRENQ